MFEISMDVVYITFLKQHYSGAEGGQKPQNRVGTLVALA